LSEIQLTKRI